MRVCITIYKIRDNFHNILSRKKKLGRIEVNLKRRRDIKGKYCLPSLYIFGMSVCENRIRKIINKNL